MSRVRIYDRYSKEGKRFEEGIRLAKADPGFESVVLLVRDIVQRVLQSFPDPKRKASSVKETIEDSVIAALEDTAFPRE